MCVWQPSGALVVVEGAYSRDLLSGVRGRSHHAYYDTELSAKRVAVHWAASKSS